MPIHHRRLRSLAVTTVLAAVAAMPACYYPGGPLYSADRYTYESTSWSPKTVTMIDTRSGEAVWAVDVPVDTQVVIAFSEGTGPNPLNPDEIVWQLMRQGKRFGVLESRQPAPPSASRRLDLSIRAAPEIAGEQEILSPFTPEGTRTPAPTAEPSPGAGGTSVPGMSR